eukprot:Em0023g512a
MIGTGDAEKLLTPVDNGIAYAESELDSDLPPNSTQQGPAAQPHKRGSSSFALPLGTPAAKEAAKSFWNTTMLYSSVDKIAHYVNESLSCDNSPVPNKKADNVEETINHQLSFRPVGLLDSIELRQIIDTSSSNPCIGLLCSRSTPCEETSRSESELLYKTTSCPTSSELAMMYSNSNTIFP